MAIDDGAILSQSQDLTSNASSPGGNSGPAPGVAKEAQNVIAGEGEQTPALGKRGRGGRVAQRVNGEELRGRVYSWGDLSIYGWRDRLLIRAADLFFFVLIKCICSTLRWEVRGAEHLDSILGSEHRAIFTFWHSCIFTATWLWRKRGIVVMSSRSRDGEFTGRFIKRFGYGTARGSSSRGASRALAEMAACLEHGIDVAFTIDGPRGPAYVAKAGAVTLARHTGQAILPFHITARRRIRLGSWDRLQIPLPFTRALALVGKPIYVGRDAAAGDLELKQSALQEALDAMRDECEKWRRAD
ncbi:MAG TPA: lysophospholipid acyltransferase family protein [Blastocatellia bacterium]|nr:lysophospholipid acyltransferase family protein [Blastocatellia bacterium]